MNPKPQTTVSTECTKRAKMKRNEEEHTISFYISRIFSVSIHSTALQVLQNTERIRLTKMGFDKANGKKRDTYMQIVIFSYSLFLFCVPAVAFVLNSHFLQIPAFSFRLNKTSMPNIMSIHVLYIVFIPNCF